MSILTATEIYTLLENVHASIPSFDKLVTFSFSASKINDAFSTFKKKL